MKRIHRWFDEIFSPKELQRLDAMEIVDAMNDPVIRKTWLFEAFEELKRMNLDVDKCLLNGGYRIEDLCARRKAFQDVLEYVLSAKRTVVMARDHNHNSRSGGFDLDSVAVHPSPG